MSTTEFTAKGRGAGQLGRGNKRSRCLLYLWTQHKPVHVDELTHLCAHTPNFKKNIVCIYCVLGRGEGAHKDSFDTAQFPSLSFHFAPPRVITFEHSIEASNYNFLATKMLFFKRYFSEDRNWHLQELAASIMMPDSAVCMPFIYHSHIMHIMSLLLRSPLT